MKTDKRIFVPALFLMAAAVLMAQDGGKPFGEASMAAKSEKRADLLRRYGNAVILQGGFLLVFDLVMYFVFHDMRPGNIELAAAMINGEALAAGLKITF